MSQKNVEAVRTLFDAFSRIQGRLRRGQIPFGEPFAEDVELDVSILQLPDVGSGIYHGREGARRLWMDWLSAWEDVHFEYELVDAGENVVALLRRPRADADRNRALTRPRIADAGFRAVQKRRIGAVRTHPGESRPRTSGRQSYW
jgi:hypothetical protein